MTEKKCIVCGGEMLIVGAFTGHMGSDAVFGDKAGFEYGTKAYEKIDKMPEGIRICDDELTITFCSKCGKIEGKFPVSSLVLI